MIVQDICIYTIAGAVLEKTIIVPVGVPNYTGRICAAIEKPPAICMGYLISPQHLVRNHTSSMRNY